MEESSGKSSAYIPSSSYQEGYAIRNVDLRDAEQIAEIYRPIVENTTISFESEAPDAEEIKNRIRQTLKFHAWIVCLHNDQVAGYAYSGSYRPRSAYKWSIEMSVYVHADHRKRGIAHALYSALHAISRRQGYRKSYALMTVPNLPSRSFHIAFGYRPLTIFTNVGFKFGEWHDTEWFELDLAERTSPVGAIVPISKLPPEWLETEFQNSLHYIHPPA